MTTKRMLIDTTHPEETRVVVLDGKRLEEFDVEVATRKQLKGNIYLAKVVRVEPSLQAAFVDYGGNRHGFLAFNEIHPDYYQIPVADREALIAEQAAEDTAEDDAPAATAKGEGTEASKGVETVGGDDIEEVEERRSLRPQRRYRIQEVIKRRQILLIQVVKEERGNKGAALTTYLSLAGRYCVLMPNTARGGGISRKISNPADRKRLKALMNDLKIPTGLGVIVRTAGAERNKTEIKRDYGYLMRLWDSVRELTLSSTAPSLVYEEADLIKRAIRDLYSSDIEEVVVEGEEGYRRAKDFMKMLIPSHAKKVKQYNDPVLPLLQRNQVESQIDAMHSPVVQLKSGGYIVINSTEALVAIDVNSGRATRERNIEQTALKTNLEAAAEVARQLRLRDLAGLIVIDFIDMEVSRNNTKVERQLKDSMRNDRARIQLGRISPFGLLELSRQRLHPSLFETSFEACVYCGGTGARRSTESTALHVLRAIEEEGGRRRVQALTVHVPVTIALYILNQKRMALNDIEQRHELRVMIFGDDSLIPPDFRIERDKKAPTALPQEPPAKKEKAADAAQESDEADDDATTTEDSGKRRRRRRPRRRKTAEGDSAAVSETKEPETEEEAKATAAEEEAETTAAKAQSKAADEESPGKRRRRGRRGGRRRGRRSGADTAATGTEGEAAVESPGEAAAVGPFDTVDGGVDSLPDVIALPGPETAPDTADAGDEPKPPAKKPARRRRAAKATDKPEAKPEAMPAGKQGDPKAEATPKKRTPRPRKRKPRPKTEAEIVSPGMTPPAEPSMPALADAPKEDAAASGDASMITDIGVQSNQPPASKASARKGWWQRLSE
ncbi:MAG: ribonuclease E/G [Rhodospirillales bacterium]|nr:ribonuclease E/G [Rhodospirillales bacterium]